VGALGRFGWSGGEQGSQGWNSTTSLGEYPGPLPRMGLGMMMKMVLSCIKGLAVDQL
jgi:hypothetical protein